MDTVVPRRHFTLILSLNTTELVVTVKNLAEIDITRSYCACAHLEIWWWLPFFMDRGNIQSGKLGRQEGEIMRRRASERESKRLIFYRKILQKIKREMEAKMDFTCYSPPHIYLRQRCFFFRACNFEIRVLIVLL